MKKRKVLMAALIIFAMGFLPACDLLEECGTCELVTEDATGNKDYGPPLTACGEQLKDKEDQAPVTVGGVTTYWNCY